jgi:hypothetical protein
MCLTACFTGWDEDHWKHRGRTQGGCDAAQPGDTLRRRRYLARAVASRPGMRAAPVRMTLGAQVQLIRTRSDLEACHQAAPMPALVDWSCQRIVYPPSTTRSAPLIMSAALDAR